MAELPTMPLRTDALLGDTTHLSATEFGAYMRLLITMWRNGGWLPSDPKRLARYASLGPNQWAKTGPILMEFFIEVEGGKITQGRLADEYQGAVEKSASATNSATARWRKRDAKKAPKKYSTPPVLFNSTPPVENNNEHPKPLENMETHDADALRTQSERNAIQDPESLGTDVPKESPVIPFAERAKRAKPRTRINSSAPISEEQLLAAVTKGLSEREAKAEFDRFRDWAVAKGQVYADWNAAWRNWITSSFRKPIGNRQAPGLGTGFYDSMGNWIRDIN